MKLIYTKGYPGCGKSTLAKKLVEEHKGSLVEVNRDELRKAHPKYKKGKFSKEVEKDILAQRNNLIEANLAAGYDVISSDTNLGKVLYFVEIANKYKAGLIRLDFTDPTSQYYQSLEACMKRDLLREDSVGKDVILRMWHEGIKKVPKPDTKNLYPAAWIVDIDGTLAHHDGLRSPFEEKYEVDSVDETVLEAVKAFSLAGHKIIILSGREGTVVGQTLTLEWLKTHNIPYDKFHMRKDGDRRSDDIVKKEIYEQYIKNQYHILGVIDDRPRVIRMWEEQGLKVLKCGPGIEF